MTEYFASDLKLLNLPSSLMGIRKPIDPFFSSAILDVLPDALVWMQPVFGNEGAVEDFEVGFANKAAIEGINHPKGSLIGLRIRRDGVPSRESAEANFKHYYDVYQSGEIKEYTFFAHHSNRKFETIRRPHEGGVLSTTRDRSAQREAEYRAEKTRHTLESIIESSTNGIVAFDAVRDEKGKIVDFQLRYHNSQRNELLGLSAEQGATYTFRQVLQHLDSESFFDQYVEVVEKDAALQREQFVVQSQKWLSISTVKLEDGFLAMLTDITELKRSQQRLRHQSQYLNSILNSSLIAVVTMEAVRSKGGQIVDLRYTQVNKRFLQWLTKGNQEVVGRTMLSLFPKTKETGIFDLYKQAIETGAPQQMEVWYNDGEINAWYDLSVDRLDENTAVATFNDITQRKQAHEQMKEQKKLLDNILQFSSNSISVGEMIRDNTGKIVDIKTILANDAAIKLTGIPKEIYLSKTAREIDPNFIDSPYFQMCVKSMETGVPFLTQYFLESVGRWMEISVSKMDEDHQIYIFTDVTTIKEAQLALERSAERLSTIIDTSHAGFFMGSPVLNEEGEIIDFRFTLVNKVMASFVEEEPENLIGQLGSQRFVKYKTNGLFERFREIYLTRNKQQFDFHYQSEKIEVWANLLVTRIGDEILGTFTDLTQVKKLQHQLETMVEELKRSNASLEEFAYAASHDLQEPLRKIHTFSDKLRQELSSQLNSVQQRMFERIENATHRMRALINDLLAFSHVSAKLNEFDQIDLNALTEAVLQDLEATISETKAVITLDKLPVVKGNERQLRQMLQNLIGNALKYRKPDVTPEVHITCNTVENADNELSFFSEKPKGEYYLIKIKDNGIGFDQQYAESIFQVFQRLHGRAEYEGTGIGLAIVQKVVQNHNGLIAAEGKPGIGATFRVLLPQ